MTLPVRYERWLYPVTIDSTNDSFQIRVDGGSFVTLTIPQGDYLVTFGGGLGLLDAVVTALAGAGVTATFEPTTPTGTSIGPIGARLVVSGVTSFQLRILPAADATSPTLDQILGLDGGDTFAVGGVIEPVGAMAGVWVPGVRRRTYEPRPEGVLEGSTEFTERADFYANDYGSRLIRRVEYEYIQSPFIFTGRAQLIDYAQNSPAALGDDSNAFERLWERMRRGDSIFVIHFDDNSPGPSLAPPDTSAGGDPPAEELRARNVRDVQRMAQIVRPQVMGGEYYAVAFDAVVVASSYAY